MTDETYMEMRAKEIFPETLPETAKELKDNQFDNNWQRIQIAIVNLLVIVGFCFFLLPLFKGQVNDATLACLPHTCDLNKVYDNQAVIFSGLNYNIQQDANIFNAIKAESNAQLFLSRCKAISVDYNKGEQTIVCPTQGGG